MEIINTEDVKNFTESHESRLICDKDDNGLFLTLRSVSIDYPKRCTIRIWKYNYFTKCWTCLEPFVISYRRPRQYDVIQLDNSRLLYINQEQTVELYSYNIVEQKAERLNVSENSWVFNDYGLTKFRNQIFVTSENKLNSNFEVRTINIDEYPNLRWRNISVQENQPQNMIGDYKIIVRDQKLLVVGWRCLSEQQDDYRCDIVFSFDLNSHKWSNIKTFPDLQNGYPSELCAQAEPILRNSLSYFVSDYSSDERIDYNIWQLDLVTFQWKLLSITYPQLSFVIKLGLTSDGYMIIFNKLITVSNGVLLTQERGQCPTQLLKLNLRIARMETLQDLCWKNVVKSLEHDGRVQINSFSKEQLLDIGVCKKFVYKLFW